MKCGICKQEGHTKRTCPTLTRASEPEEKKEVDDGEEKRDPVLCRNTLSVASWKDTRAYRIIKEKETQKMYYRRMSSSEDVLHLVDLDSKPFGAASEGILQEIFHLGKRTSSQNDGTRLDKKIEIKSARYWAGKDDCKWQHLEPEHDYDHILFALLGFHEWKVWCCTKAYLMGELREKNVITHQGKQGWWIQKTHLLKHLHPDHCISVTSLQELDAFLQKPLLPHSPPPPSPPLLPSDSTADESTPHIPDSVPHQ